jgi:hypothetical protein
MVLYKCKICSKTFNRKSSYDNHMKRKKPCVPLNSTNFNLKKKINNPLNRAVSQKKEQKDYKCEYCNKSFTKKYNLNRHLDTCKIKKNQEEDKKKKDYYDLIMKKLENQDEIIKDIQENLIDSVKAKDVKDIIKILKNQIKCNRSEIIKFKYKV